MSVLRIFNRINLVRIPQMMINKNVMDNFIKTTTWSRFKHTNTQYTGVKGIRNRKSQFSITSTKNDDEDENQEDIVDLDDREYDDLASSTMNVSRNVHLTEERVFVIQPYIKWGPKKSVTHPDLQLQEAEALIRSLPQWSVELSLKVPLESLEKKTFFGSGKMKEIKEIISKHRSQGKVISRIFISKGTLSFVQKRFLQNEFNIPIMDRYSVVIQILRLHATSAEAKLQVALAEIPYIWSQMKDLNPSISRKIGYSLTDSQRELLNKREKKLKQEIENIRNHRKLLRNKRRKENYPIIAVVGYTNAGKTSLIKALTNEQTMQPRDQLFATLDVTAHAGILPCKLEVIYMDTVGFMSDIPTGLIECFISTLEDAMLSDIIIHVQDLSHENHDEQRRHVENTLKSLSCFTLDNENDDKQIPPIINVGNKIDLIKDFQSEKYENLKLVSSKTLIGINDLMLDIESKILKATNRIKLIMRVSNGGQEMAWLYKNAAITISEADPKNEQYILLHVIIHQSKLQIFEHYFVKKNRN